MTKWDWDATKISYYGLYLGGIFLSIAFTLTLTSFFPEGEFFDFERLQKSVPFWILGLIGFLVYQQSPFIDEKWKIFAFGLLIRVFGLITLWWIIGVRLAEVV